MTYQDIIFDISGGIATLTLNRTDIRNAITGSRIIGEIEDVCRIVNADMTIKVMIITAKDPSFSAGGNIKDMADKKGMFAGTPAQVMENYRKNIQRIPLAVHEVEVPTIAAVNGPAIGAGCDLALMCDMRIASDKAKFGETFLAVGLIPGDGGAYFLPRTVGMARACELTFTAEVIDAKTALNIGLVNDMVPHEALMQRAQALAEKIASQPAQALRMAKRLLYMGQSLTLRQLLEQSASYQAFCHSTNDHMEALSAMFEKRKPDFRGE
ncbi:MAG: crotonase/enoyl-CoA hydratase family protein [Desulfobacterales bacterium]|jgi:enoyl-CoA hydratase/carnithine racemase|nr:crotonase/enoyl-CoA hydratase family protein [Desulfobacterales bacterium]